MARIAITGANSTVGIAILGTEALNSAQFICCVRSERAASELPDPSNTPHVIERIDYAQPGTLEASFSMCDVIIHLPGVLVERKGSTYEAANVETTRLAVAAALQNAATSKFVLVSAIGANAGSKNRYYRTKGEAERIVRESGLPHTILRAPLVLGSGTEGSDAILRYARARRPRMPGGGRNLQQPLDVRDLARAVLHSTLPDVAPHRTLDLVGIEALQECEIVKRTARELGRDVNVGSAPIAHIRFLSRLRSAFLGAGFSPDAIDVITADTRLPNHAAREVGIELTPLDTTIRNMTGKNS